MFSFGVAKTLKCLEIPPPPMILCACGIWGLGTSFLVWLGDHLLQKDWVLMSRHHRRLEWWEASWLQLPAWPFPKALCLLVCITMCMYGAELGGEYSGWVRARENQINEKEREKLLVWANKGHKLFNCECCQFVFWAAGYFSCRWAVRTFCSVFIN